MSSESSPGSVLQPSIAAAAADPDPVPDHVVDGPVPEIAPALAAEVPDVPVPLQAHLLLVRRA